MLSLEGKQLGNYDVIRPIRVGGMGAVYEGRQRTAFGRRVAIKVIHNDYAGDLDMRRRFAREARTIARLQHPHILPLIEFGDEQGILYLVMPLIEGGTLTSYLRHNLPDLDEVASIYGQLLDAVEYAHEEGLIHRDIKSSNVLLEMRRNGPPHIYLADFGLVRVIRPNDSVSPAGRPIPLDQVPGTPHYMAPEQTRGIVTPLTDIYALGVLLYQLLTGVLPYNHPDEVRVIQMHLSAPIPSPSDRDASIPYELDEVVRIAMAKRPEDRYQSVSGLRQGFLAALSGPVTYGYGVETRDERQDHDDPHQPYSQQSKSLRDEKTALPLPPQQTLAISPEPIVLQRKPPQEPPRRTRDLSGEIQGLPLRPSPENTSETRQQAKIIHRLDRADRTRTTDSIRENRAEQEDRNRPHNTEEPPLPLGAVAISAPKRTKRHPFMLVLIAATVLAVILVVVLTPLGMNIIQKVGGALNIGSGGSQATVQITEKPNPLQESYVLTASQQYSTPDPGKFAMPARVLQSSFSDGNTAATTGQKTIAATAAQGTLLFINPGTSPVDVSQGQNFATGSGGITVTLTQSVTVPGKQNTVDGTATALAISVNPGKAGNIAPLAISTQFTPAGSSTITVQNLTAFSGGNDAQIIHIVTQADIDGLLTNLRNKLTPKAEQQLQSQLVPDEVMATQPTRSENFTSNFPVNAQVDQVQVTLTIQESVTVYKPSVAIQIAATLLKNEANRNLGTNYKQVGDITKVGDPTISAVQNDAVILSVTVHGTWVYNFTTAQTDQWRQAIKGLKPADARSYLKGQNGIADVQIQLPTGTDRLPNTIDNIKILFV